MLKAALLVVSFSGLFGTVAAAQAPKPVASQGRYQIVISPHNARDTFLLDTETGRVWQLAVLSYLKGEPAVWDLMPRIDTPEDRDKVVSDFGRKGSR